MSQIAAAGRTARAGAVWEAPDLAMSGRGAGGQVSAAVFHRGSGGGVWRSPWHRLVLSPALVGPVALSLDGGPAHRFTAQPGTLAFCPAGTEARAAHGPGRMIQVLQDPLLYRGLVPEIGGDDPASLAPLIDFTDPLIALIARSLASEVEHGAADRLLVDGLSTALAVRIARRFASWRPPDPDARGLSRERLRRVLDHIEAHLGGELALADLAAVACLSPFHFSRCFKRAVGVGPQRYVVRRRVERARDMIRRTDEPLAAVAQALGFADQSHFTHVFRRETGETPARFRTTAAA